MLIDNGEQQYFNRLLEIKNLQFYIKFFLSICETKNITKTAYECNVSKSSVSRYLTKLEQIIQKKLFIRKGVKGVKITNDGEILQFFLEKIKATINDNLKNLNNFNIKLSIHTLAFKRHILPMLKILSEQNKNITVSIFESGVKKAIKKLNENAVDAIFFPLDTILVSKIEQQKIEIIKLKKYNLCLYINKNNKYANIKESKVSWSILKELNVCPMNVNTSFKTFYDILHVKNCKCTTTTTNILTLYNGVKEGIWSMAMGDEVEDYVDCSFFVKKQANKTVLFGSNIFWCLCYKKDNEQKLKDIINIFKSIKRR